MALLRRLTQRRAYREYYPELSLADRSHRRRSPWRRRPGPWLATASLLACLLITAVGSGFAALATFQSPDQRLIALGDVLTGGIFLLALVAGILSVIAYVNSLHRPTLRTTWEFLWLDGTSSLDQIPADQNPGGRGAPARLPPYVDGVPVPLEPVILKVTLENDGDAVARNVTVAVYMEGIFFDPPPTPGPDSKWKITNIDNTGWWRVQYNSGDRVVYPGDTRTSTTIELSGMWAAPRIPSTGWGSVITAEDTLGKAGDQPLNITIARPLPATAPAAAVPSLKKPRRQRRKSQPIPPDDPQEITPR